MARELNSRRLATKKGRRSKGRRNQNRRKKKNNKKQSRPPGGPVPSSPKLKRRVPVLNSHHMIPKPPAYNKNFVSISSRRKSIQQRRRKRRNKRIQQQTIRNLKSKKTAPTELDLIYLEDSPSFCEQDKEFGESDFQFLPITLSALQIYF